MRRYRYNDKSSDRPISLGLSLENRGENRRADANSTTIVSLFIRDHQNFHDNKSVTSLTTDYMYIISRYVCIYVYTIVTYFTHIYRF